MLSSIYNYFYGEVQVEADPKVLRQKYLVLVQIKDHKIRLKPLKFKKIPLPKRPFIWKKPVIL